MFLCQRSGHRAHRIISGSSCSNGVRPEPVFVLIDQTRTTSNSVGAHGGRTMIPLSAGKAQEGETILMSGVRSHVGIVAPDCW